MIWKEKYRIGVPAVDEQHEELFRRVNDFVVVLRSPLTWEEKQGKVNETLEFMKEYVIDHFRDEEEYQLSIGYPEYETHKKIHTEMVAYVAATAEEYEREGFSEQVMQRFAGKLLAWLIHHVADSDQKIANYAMGKGV